MITTAEEAVAALRPHFENAAREQIVVLYLAADRRLLGVSSHPGSTDFADLPLRAIIAEALRLEAAGMIVAHAHPSGTAKPSEEDKAATAVLARTARALDIRLHDHLIFAGEAWASFRGLGLL
ncbi:JAB domain-containing protein [Sphingosinicella sp. BN140058]|uniref:JAB domain-containing protein n=1 Tax=Sphingosinicella sp. BN140058 TaxID=1892855 RepID=UPI0013EC87FE|nr:JAB domain-containing protein [Sphingosinicella sp. BN140058]